MKKALSLLCIAMLLAGLAACDKTCKHDYRDWIVVQDPGCTEPGTEQRRCRECNEKETREIPAVGHSYTASIVREASCTAAGIKRFTCSNCSDTYDEELICPVYEANQVFEMSKNSVGEIVTYDKNGNGLALGTGFVYAADGQIITNYHVIEGAYSAKINLNGNSYTVQRVLAYDKGIDLAVLKIGAGSLTPLPICKNDHAVGKTVYAFGSSRGMTATFSRGIITFADREGAGVHYVQHDAAISSGNSGGPLINEYGEVIGVNTLSFKDSQNLNFAISVRELDNLDFSKSMTLAEVYEAEQDISAMLKDYLIANGTLSQGSYIILLGSDTYWDHSFAYISALGYHVQNDMVMLMLTCQDTSANLFHFSFTFTDAGMMWVYTNGTYSMAGPIDPASFRSGSSLQYSKADFPASQRSKILSQSETLAALLCSRMDQDLGQIGLTAEDLGFVYF